MTETSFPKVELPLTDAEWQTIALPMGRGVIDRGGFPYRVTAQDSVTDEIEIGVDSRTGKNEAILDGFIHRMTAPKRLPIPPVAIDTIYEVGLVYDPTQHDAPGGPIMLDAWAQPADYSGGKSRIVLYEVVRKPNVGLGASAVREYRPRAVAWLSVSQERDLPRQGLVLVDTLAYVGWDQSFHRARIDEAGVVTWEKISGGSGDLPNYTSAAEPNTIVQRGGDGSFLIEQSEATKAPTTVGYVNNRASWSGLPGKPSTFPPSSHKHAGEDITSGTVPHARIEGSRHAYYNTNTGSTWASVVAKVDTGEFARYPSALKYKKNVRSWSLEPATIYGLTPVKYEDVQNGDTRVGFVADSYVNTFPELVEIDPNTGEIEGWKYMLTCVAQQVAIRDLNDRVTTLENTVSGLLERVADLETGAP